MGKLDLRILMEKDDFIQLHDMMGMKVLDENDMILHRMTNAVKKQDWYREVIREGMISLLKKFSKRKKELKDED